MCDHCEHNQAEEKEAEAVLEEETCCCGGNCEDCSHEE